MENRQNCCNCSKKPLWICKCLNLYFCQRHAEKHTMEHTAHRTLADLVKIKPEIPSEDRENFKKIIMLKISEIKYYKNKVTQETLDYIKKIEMLCNAVICKLDEISNEYYKLINEKNWDEKEAEYIKEIENSQISTLKFKTH